MNVPDQHSNNESALKRSSITLFQPHGFRSVFEPESFEDFDFESSPMTFHTTSQDDEAIPQSSGVTANSTAPILKQTAEEKLVYKDRPFRNYQIYPSHTKFLLGGRLVTSRDFRAFIAALFLLIAPAVLFIVFTCPFLWRQVHPVIPILFAYIFVLALVSMLKTSWTDPGIIPRNLDPVEKEFDDSDSTLNDKEIQIKGTSYSLKYCETCKIYRPPRSSHCRQCDNCVEFEDHHCMWLNNCVGKRNYRPFFTFIFATAILCLFVILSAIYHLHYISKYSVDQPPQFSAVFAKAPVSFVLAIICFILLWLVGGLTLFHCSLLLKGITTHEQIRAAFIKAKYPGLTVNPYSKRNPVKNMIQVLCQPQPKSYLQRRKMADPVIVIENFVS